MSKENGVLRTAIMRAMSEMLDNPDEHGIYPTGEFMDRMEQLLVAMMAAPEVVQLSGSEALFGFMAWLTSGSKRVGPLSSLANHAVQAAGLVDEFCRVNNLADPREGWSQLLTQPPTGGTK